MAILFTNAKVFIGGYDLSGDLNEVALEYGVEALDTTVFGASSRTMRGGLKTSRVTGRGFVQHGGGLVGESLFNELGQNDRLVMLFPDGITQGATSTGSGYMFKAVETQYSHGGAVGEMLSFDFAAEGRGAGA